MVLLTVKSSLATAVIAIIVFCAAQPLYAKSAGGYSEAAIADERRGMKHLYSKRYLTSGRLRI